MVATIGVVLRDYNGFIITRDESGKVTSMKADDQTPIIRANNKAKFGERTEDGHIIKNGKKFKDERTEQINEANRRLKKWQQEQQ